jgi:hypothetical protein
MEFRYISFHVNASSERPADACGQMGDMTKVTETCETANTRPKKKAKSKKMINVCSERYYIKGKRFVLAFTYITQTCIQNYCAVQQNNCCLWYETYEKNRLRKNTKFSNVRVDGIYIYH